MKICTVNYTQTSAVMIIIVVLYLILIAYIDFNECVNVHDW